MSDPIAARAETVKLARVLDVEPGRLGYLEQVDPEAIRALRDQVVDRLYEADKKTFQGLANASKRLPMGLAAQIGKRAFGAVLCSRVAAQLEPDRAVQLAGHLDPPFLADIGVAIDPRRIRDVLTQLPTQTIVAVAQELLARDEHVVMGRFVAFLSAEAIAACVGILDDTSLLKIAFVLEDRNRLDEIIELLGDERRATVIAVAQRDELLDEAIVVLRAVNPGRRAQLLAASAAQDRKKHAELLALAPDLQA